MKKKILVLVMLVLCLFGLAACEEVVAPQGDKGDQGNPGKSAYEVAVDNGFTGDINAWLESLKGAQGQTGKTGATGQNGQNGQNANEIEVFVEDGGLYWHYVDKDGNAVGEDQLLYFYQDYITLTYSKKEFDQVEDLVATFLADVSAASGKEVTGENFADTFDSDGKFMGDNNGKPIGLMADNPSLFNKYKFMIQWVYDNLYARPSSDQFFSNDTSHKYELATLEAFGINTSWSNAKADRGHNTNYGNKNIVANIANFLNGDGKADGTSDYYPTGSFEGVDRSGVVAGGVALLPPVVIKRADLATYELKTFEKNDPIMGDGYSFVKWVDAKGIEVKNGELKNHSQELFIVTNFDGIFVTLLVDNKDAGVGFEAEPLTNVNKNDVVSPAHEGYVFLGWVDENGNAIKPGAMRDGGTYQATWRKNNKINLGGAWMISDFAALFCADLSDALSTDEAAVTVTPENFYELLAGKFMNVDSIDEQGNYVTSGLMKDNPELFAKWQWLIEYVAEKMGDVKYGNTSLVAFGLRETTNVVTSSLEYCDWTVTNSISNFLNCANENLHGGGSSGAVPANFGKASAYKGFDELVYAQVEAGTITMPEASTESVTYTGVEEFVFFKAGSEFGGYSANGADPIQLSQLKQGVEYDVYWASRVEIDYNGGYVYSKQAIIDEFLADVSAAAGKEVAAEDFYSTFSEKFMNVTAYDSETKKYSVNGLMADHPELLAKWGWLIEFVGQVMGNKKYGNTALVAFGLTSANDGNLVTSSLHYADRAITNSVHNFLNGIGDTLHGGSSSGAIPADFSTEEAYNGLAELAAQNNALETSTFAFAKDVPAIIAKMEYAHHKFLGFYDAEDAEQKLVASYEEMKLAGHKYIAKWEAAVTIDLDGGYAIAYAGVIDGLMNVINTARAARELAPIEKADFYATYTVDTSATSDEALDNLMEDLADYKWVFNFVLSQGKTSNKRISAIATKYGLTYNYTSSSTPTLDAYSYQNLVNWIHNFLNESGATLHNGSAKDYPAADFSTADKYEGFGALALENNFVPESAKLTGSLELYLSDGYIPTIAKEGDTFLGFNKKLAEGVNVKAVYGTAANVTLLPGHPGSNAGFNHAANNWQVDKYYNDQGWVLQTEEQMRYRTASDGTKVVNFAAGYSMAMRYTYNMNGESLGIANTLTLKAGNYFNGAQEMKIKVSIIDINGNTIYLLGDANNWFTMPVTGGNTPLIPQTFTFDAVEVQSVRITVNSPINGGAYFYVSDDALLSFVAE